MQKRAALVALATALALIPMLMGAAGAVAKHNPPYAIKPKPPKPKPKPLQYNVTTKVAIAFAENPIYRRPTTHSAVVKDLAFYTPDGEALQTYRLIKNRRVGRTLWELIDVPMRPNGQSGWVERSWLGAAMVSRTVVVVDIPARTVTVYKRGKQVFSVPVGVGKATTPTPTGHFWIAEEFPSQNPFYGPWAFGTTDYAADTEFPDGSIVGLHGTDQPDLIPGDPSHGCIRFKDADILQMRSYVSIGSAVWIE